MNRTLQAIYGSMVLDRRLHLIDLTRCGDVLPRDAGQAVGSTWHTVYGGVVRCEFDRSDAYPAATAAYSFHRWKFSRREHAPQNGVLGCIARGRRITREEAERLVREAGWREYIAGCQS